MTSVANKKQKNEKTMTIVADINRIRKFTQ